MGIAELFGLNANDQIAETPPQQQPEPAEPQQAQPEPQPQQQQGGLQHDNMAARIAALEAMLQQQMYQQQMAQQQGQPEPEPLKPPEKPKKPSSSDPFSDEWKKYYEDLAEYNEKLAEYNQAIMQQTLSPLQQALEEELRQQQIMEVQRRQLARFYQEAITVGGATPEEAKAFVEWIANPVQDIREALDIWRKAQAGSSQPASPRQVAPPPPAATGQKGEPPKQAEDQLADLLLGYGNRLQKL